MDISRRIYDLLDLRSMTQKKLAELAGVSVVYINQICQGRKTPTLDTLQAICDALSVSLHDFFADPSSDELVLNEDEKRLIKYFRSIPPHERDAVLEMTSLLNRHVACWQKKESLIKSP